MTDHTTIMNNTIKIIDDEKREKLTKEDQLYNDAIIALEKLNIYSKVKLLQKMAEDYGLDKPYYCSACTEISQTDHSSGSPEFVECDKCHKTFCEGCVHEGDDSPTTSCDKCNAFFCRDCATREMANKLHCKNCKNKRNVKRGKTQKKKVIEIDEESSEENDIPIEYVELSE